MGFKHKRFCKFFWMALVFLFVLLFSLLHINHTKYNKELIHYPTQCFHLTKITRNISNRTGRTLRSDQTYLSKQLAVINLTSQILEHFNDKLVL